MYFSTEQCSQFSSQYEAFRGVTVDPEVLDDIVTLSRGHPGLFARCFNQMEEWLLSGSGRPHESFETDWRPLRRRIISGELLMKDPAVHRMILDLCAADNPAVAATYDLLNRLLTDREPFTIKSSDMPAAKLLAQIGVLRLADKNA